MSKTKPLYDHALQLRLSSATVAQIDDAILTYKTLNSTALLVLGLSARPSDTFFTIWRMILKQRKRWRYRTC